MDYMAGLESLLEQLQQRLVEYASGPTDVLARGGSIIPQINPTAKSLCTRQMLSMLNTLGAVIILAVGTSLILLSLCVEIIVRLVQLMMGKHHPRLSGFSNGYLQLQCMAYEGAEYDRWKDCASNHLVFGEAKERVQMLGALDDSNITHPRLSKIFGGNGMLLEKPS
ncbi:hypothetical protein EG329_004872 [Mollisiaceae sp. DMI_Dod_QoI]|nr:hypothetical protein EG329_004872 [Helotiales sp. DMI_Dod_QoI]